MQKNTIVEGTIVFVTKHAISGKGKPMKEAVRRIDGEYVYLMNQPNYYSIRLNKDAFLSEKEADAAILDAFDRKIAQVKKQLAKLEKIRVEIADRVKK